MDYDGRMTKTEPNGKKETTYTDHKGRIIRKEEDKNGKEEKIEI